MSCRVVNLKDDQYDVYIGRPSKWGNPFSHMDGTLAKFKVATRHDAVMAYKQWVKQQPELMASLDELEGKTLGCHCKPKECHGDVLAEIVANRMLSRIF